MPATKSRTEITIQNIVVSTSLEHDIPLIKVKESLQKIIKNLAKIKIRIKIKPKINVQNMVASGSIHMDLNLNSLAMKLDNTEYEPEQFPGLVYKLAGTKATFLLFSNGKIVCTGTKSETKLREAVKKLVVVLKKVK